MSKEEQIGKRLIDVIKLEDLGVFYGNNRRLIRLCFLINIMKALKLFLIALLIVSLSSCGFEAKHEQIEEIEIGMHLDEVFDILYETGWD